MHDRRTPFAGRKEEEGGKGGEAAATKGQHAQQEQQQHSAAVGESMCKAAHGHAPEDEAEVKSFVSTFARSRRR